MYGAAKNNFESFQTFFSQTEEEKPHPSSQHELRYCFFLTHLPANHICQASSVQQQLPVHSEDKCLIFFLAFAIFIFLIHA